MEIFIDTASVSEIKNILPWGIISGVTTNQKIFLAEKGCDFKKRVMEILSLVDGPVSVELTKTDGRDEDMILEAIEYSKWNQKNLVVKVPMFGSGRGLRIVNELREHKVKTNMTALMSTNQVILAAKAGATFASVFFNRVKDSGDDPVRIIRESKRVMEESAFPTKIIAGSMRKPEDVVDAAVAGAHIVTIPYKILVQMPYHTKTEETIAEFDKAWQEFKKTEKATMSSGV